MLRRTQRSVIHTHAFSIILLLDCREKSVVIGELAMSMQTRGTRRGRGSCAPSCKHVQRRGLAAGTIASRECSQNQCGNFTARITDSSTILRWTTF